MELKDSSTIWDVLHAWKKENKKVGISVKSGPFYRGKIGDLGKLVVQIKELEGREFFDAFINIEDICAIEVKVRS